MKSSCGKAKRKKSISDIKSLLLGNFGIGFLVSTNVGAQQSGIKTHLAGRQGETERDRPERCSILQESLDRSFINRNSRNTTR